MTAFVRTYSRADWLRASLAWQDFGDEWAWVRKAAADSGIIWPPFGSANDDRDAAHPSQRAIVYRAMTDNPNALRGIIANSGTWSTVVGRIISFEENVRRRRS